jgi:hypothetical protein
MIRNMRTAVAVIALALCVACDDDSPVTVDAAIPDSPPTPAIDWTIWGQPCTRAPYGMVACTASDGTTRGLCIQDTQACEPGCLSQPGHATECPADGVRTENPANSDGCWCKERM